MYEAHDAVHEPHGTQKAEFPGCGAERRMLQIGDKAHQQEDWRCGKFHPATRSLSLQRTQGLDEQALGDHHGRFAVADLLLDRGIINQKVRSRPDDDN